MNARDHQPSNTLFPKDFQYFAYEIELSRYTVRREIDCLGDGLAATRRYILEAPDAIGLHYVELGSDTLEFVSISRQNDGPDAEGSSRG